MNGDPMELNTIRWKRIGIIGGLGPRASAHFYKLLIDICSQEYGATNDFEYPSLVLVSLNGEGLSEKGFAINQFTLIDEINYAMKVFSETNVNIVAVACNSVFAYQDQFRRYPSIRLVDIPDELASAVSNLKADNVIILCSQGLRATKIYDKYFLSAGLKTYYPDSSTQDLLDQIIFDVMSGKKIDQAKLKLAKIVETLSRSYDVVVLACSEFSVLIDVMSLPSNIVDSMQVLATRSLKLSVIETP